MLEGKDGVMAVWIGDFPTQKEFDAYVEEYEGKPSKKHPLSQFAKEAGDEWYDHDFFTAWRFPKAKDVAGLLAGAPYVESYGEAVAALAKKAGVTRGNTVILLQDVVLKPAKWPADSRLKYLGAVPYEIPGPPTPELRKTDHQSAVMYVAVGGDGKRAVTSDYNGELRLWDLAKGKLLGVAAGKGGEWGDAFTSVELALGGGAVVLGKEQATLRTITAKGFGPPQKLPMKAYNIPACSIGISPSGKLAAVGGRGELLVFDLAKKRLRCRVPLPQRTVSSPLFLDEDRVLGINDTESVVTSDQKLGVWNATTGELLFEFVGTIKSGGGLQLASGGKLAIWANNYQVELLDLGAHQGVKLLHKSDESFDTALVSPDQTILAILDGAGALHLLDLPSGKKRKSIKAHAGGSSAIAFSPNSELLLTCGGEASVKLWNVATGKQVAEFSDAPADRQMPESYESDGYTLRCAAAAGDNKTFLVGENSGRVHILRLTGKKLAALSP
jgi:WD40 repeat protein